MTVFEDPHLIPADDTVLQEGMVLAVEPGVYFAGRFGVRVENMYVVGPDGGSLELGAAVADLDGRVAVVTGGGSGLGEAIARELADAGADVALREIDGALGRPPRPRSRTPTGWRPPTPVDVSQRASVDAGLAATLEALGTPRHPGQQRRRVARRPAHAGRHRRGLVPLDRRDADRRLLLHAGRGA